MNIRVETQLVFLQITSSFRRGDPHSFYLRGYLRMLRQDPFRRFWSTLPLLFLSSWMPFCEPAQDMLSWGTPTSSFGQHSKHLPPPWGSPPPSPPSGYRDVPLLIHVVVTPVNIFFGVFSSYDVLQYVFCIWHFEWFPQQSPKGRYYPQAKVWKVYNLPRWHSWWEGGQTVSLGSDGEGSPSALLVHTSSHTGTGCETGLRGIRNGSLSRSCSYRLAHRQLREVLAEWREA